MSPLAPPDVRNTRAIVVGIEEYATGRGWRLSGPALDACRFARWLLERGVPAAHIDLLVSPLAENVAEVHALAAGLRITPANQISVRCVLADGLFETSSDLLIVHWGGHGIVDDNEFRRLFYADASERDKRNLNLSSFLTALRSHLYSGHPRQMVLVDACTTLVRGRGWAASLPDEQFPVGRPQANRDQHVLFAASFGEVAVNDDRRRTGLFSRAVQEALNDLPADAWPPDPVAVRDRVDGQFQQLRAHGHTAQIPSHLWYRSRSAEDVLVFAASPTSRWATSSASGCLLLSYQEAVQLRTIIDGAMVPDTVDGHYREVTRNLLGMPPYPDDPWAAVQALRTPVSATPLFEFLARLASGPDPVTRERLWNWIRTAAPTWSIDVDTLVDLDCRLRRTILLAQLEPDPFSTGFQVTVWSYAGGNGRQVMSASEPWPWWRIGKELSVLLADVGSVHWITPIMIFQMPMAMLDSPVEKLEIRLPSGQTEIGLLCPVVVRPLEAPGDPAINSARQHRWREVARLGDTYDPQFVGVLDLDLLSLVEPARLERLICLGLIQDRASDSRTLPAALNLAHDVGVPIVLWHRAIDARPPDLASIEHILRGRPPLRLPDVVHQQRVSARHRNAPLDHPGRDVVLLWNEPHCLPPILLWQLPT